VGTGLTVAFWKLEQSASLDERGGLIAGSVPRTPRRQLFALHSVLSNNALEKTLCAAKRFRRIEVFIMMVRIRDG